MNTCSFTIPFMKSSACSKVFGECVICFGELDGVSFSSFHTLPLIHKASLNTKRLKRICNIFNIGDLETLHLLVTLIS